MILVLLASRVATNAYGYGGVPSIQLCFNLSYFILVACLSITVAIRFVVYYYCTCVLLLYMCTSLLYMCIVIAS